MHDVPIDYANEDQAFDNSGNLAGKMTIPSISLLSLLASPRSIAMLVLPARKKNKSMKKRDRRSRTDLTTLERNRS